MTCKIVCPLYSNTTYHTILVPNIIYATRAIRHVRQNHIPIYQFPTILILDAINSRRVNSYIMKNRMPT